MSTTVEQAMDEVPIWLAEALERSTAQWAPFILPLDSLQPYRIDETEGGYQRPISQSRVQDLVDKFDAGEARDIYVSQRTDGTRWILDGQHTWAALMEVGLTHWSCRVFTGLTVADEASRFAEYQSNTRRIPPVVQFNAEVIAKNPTALALDRILGEFYLRISSSKMRNTEGFIPVSSRAAYQKLYELGGEPLLRETLQLAIDAWGHKKESFRERVLQGLGYLLAYSQGEYDRTRMIAVLKNTTIKQLVEAIGPTGSGGAARSGALQIFSMYMEGMPGFPAIRKNAKDAPRLPESVPREGPKPHEFWTEDTADLGRTKIGPVAKEVKPEKPAPEAKAENPTEPASEEPTQVEAASQDSSQSDDVVEGGTSEGSGSEEEDWEYPQAAEQA